MSRRKLDPCWQGRKAYLHDLVEELPYIALAAITTPIILVGCYAFTIWVSGWWPDIGQWVWDASGWIGDQIGSLF